MANDTQQKQQPATASAPAPIATPAPKIEERNGVIKVDTTADGESKEPLVDVVVPAYRGDHIVYDAEKKRVKPGGVAKMTRSSARELGWQVVGEAPPAKVGQSLGTMPINTPLPGAAVPFAPTVSNEPDPGASLGLQILSGIAQEAGPQLPQGQPVPQPLKR